MIIHDIPVPYMNIPFPLVTYAMPVAGIFWVINLFYGEKNNSSLDFGK